ncbi:5-oxoprolinase subunit PxpA [Galbibacter mesophilus]|uniref:5-oxoprolinase subunit PxpA n=1 Tax=Galbibacter mesophilus TaxID=379069 RepID=UPI00191CF42F|nr:5-oxoprolinase subunit PxpA [Galbibacter mesophilus]MCM5662990.1 5-oxoprolinase subunit PxpA [Galbibacter mesophilus]
MRSKIIINCDLGEGIDNESSLMPFIQACNIACGGHAGDKASMRYVINLAKNHDVAIGAHPSYPDKENFGRKSLPLSEEELIQSIKSQLTDFQLAINEEKATWQHIKPHGALYNDIAKDAHLAAVFLKAIEDFKNKELYVPYGSVIAEKATQNGFKIIYEAFADRAYNNDLSLVSRKLPNAVLTSKKAILKQVKNIAYRNSVETIQNETVYIEGETFCVHSDTDNASEIVEFLYNHLETVHVE